MLAARGRDVGRKIERVDRDHSHPLWTPRYRSRRRRHPLYRTQHALTGAFLSPLQEPTRADNCLPPRDSSAGSGLVKIDGGSPGAFRKQERGNFYRRRKRGRRSIAPSFFDSLRQEAAQAAAVSFGSTEAAMIIGQIVGGEKLEIDLPTLVDTRLLIQANSGGGKSWLLRLIAERAGIQTIVLDNEGEFASLREAVDVLLVGASGELPANPRHAALLARRLLEFKVSAVVDLYELKLAERRRFVKLFLESLIHLPRELWRPTLVILDEAHIYCPERGSGEAESTEAVISLMSQGRKRGYAGIIATQRLSKLHKDAAAEANNVIIGRTWLDADQARAGDALGLSRADRVKLRDLGQGEFYAFGPALGKPGVVHFRSDQVRTTHPRPGKRHLLTAPAPSQAIRGVLGKFADLPHEAEVVRPVQHGAA